MSTERDTGAMLDQAVTWQVANTLHRSREHEPTEITADIEAVCECWTDALALLPLLRDEYLGAAWAVPLLTEASAACHGNLSVLGLRGAIKNLPDAYLGAAGLHWALRTFDDDAPTLAQIGKWESGNGPVPTPPRLLIPPKERP